MVDAPACSYSPRARSRNGVMGSFSRLMTCCMNSSRTMKFVAEVSSSMRNRRQPASMPSTTPAACEVLPLAFSVENAAVSLPLGRSLMKSVMSTLRMQRPSSARSFTAVSSASTNSRPSPAMWLYTPLCSASSRVDFPW